MPVTEWQFTDGNSIHLCITVENDVFHLNDSIGFIDKNIATATLFSLVAAQVAMQVALRGDGAFT